MRARRTYWASDRHGVGAHEFDFLGYTFNVVVFLVFTLSLSTPDAEARTWNVYHDGSGDAPFIQAAVDSALDGDRILVWPGLYDEGFIHIREKSLELISAQGPATTTIQHLSAWEPEPGGSKAVIVSGFTFESSEEDFLAFSFLNLQSMGIHDCIIEGYRAGSEIDDVVSILVTDCRFQGNEDREIGNFAGGGALRVVIPPYSYGGEIRSCEFIENSSVDGVPEQGGGGGALSITLAAHADFSITDCLFLRNEAPSGGAVYLEGVDFYFQRNTVIANRSEDGAVMRQFGGRGNIASNVFAFNETNGIYNFVGGGCGCNAYWENDGWGSNNGQWIGYCGDDGNLYVDPLFCDPDTDDYRLRDSSPLIPKNRPDDTVCGETMGAFEVGCEPNPTVPVTWGRLKARYKD